MEDRDLKRPVPVRQIPPLPTPTMKSILQPPVTPHYTLRLCASRRAYGRSRNLRHSAHSSPRVVVWDLSFVLRYPHVAIDAIPARVQQDTLLHTVLFPDGAAIHRVSMLGWDHCVTEDR